MDRNDVMNLIAVERTQDAIGQYIDTETSREVFCSVQSVTANEFFSAGQNGIDAQYKFTMFSHDYNGEELVEYRGVRYAIYRTYRKKEDLIELYAEKKAGKK